MDMEMYGSSPGTDIPHDHPTIRALAKAHRTEFRKRPKVECSVYISDARCLTRDGITTVSDGGGGRLRTGGFGFDPQEEKRQSIKNMVQATEVYIRAAMDLCSKRRDLLTP